MKTIFKKPAWLSVITTLCLITVALFFIVCCDKPENPNPSCKFGDPLTDLPWLKTIVDEFEKDAEIFGHNPHARVYQCMYKDGIGFLLEMCVDCPGAGYSFWDCKGVILCSSENNCSKFNIDTKNRKLIWEKNSIIINTALLALR